MFTLRAQARRPIVWWRHHGIRASDAFVGEYPRSGGTWLTSMLGQLALGHELTFSELNTRFPGVDGRTKGEPVLPGNGRLLRTHESWDRAYRQSIYVVRDPRDVLVSYYAFRSAYERTYGGTLIEFAGEFLRGDVGSYGRWDEHVEAWLAGTPRPHVVRYEDLRTSPEAVLGDAAQFLGLPSDDARVRQAVADNELSRMRAREDGESVDVANNEARMVRSGRVGGWRSEVPAGLVADVVEVFAHTMRRLGYDVAA